MNNKKESLLLGRLLQKLAPKIGASVFLEPEWQIAGQITFKGGRHSYFRYNTLDLNPVGAADIAKDKDYANIFMKRLGYPITPNSRGFLAPSWAKTIGATTGGIKEACAYAQKIGFPVVAKPNSGSQGVGVFLAHNLSELRRALKEIFQLDRVALIQSFISGRDYRVVVLDDQVISAYERVPLSVLGDGRSTILQLIKKKQQLFIKEKRDTRIKTKDIRISLKLAHQGKNFQSIPALDERIYLLDNANLSSGGEAIDFSHKIHPGFKKLAIQLTRDMNLRLAGVDLIIAGEIAQAPRKYWILEINAAPGLDHYATLGKPQEKLVAELYLKVLKSLEKRSK